MPSICHSTTKQHLAYGTLAIALYSLDSVMSYDATRIMVKVSNLWSRGCGFNSWLLYFNAL